MEDKMFDEMMEKYARSTSKGMEHDLGRMNSAEQKPPVKTNRKIVFAACSVVLSVCICLAIVLPLTIGTERNDANPPSQFYYSDAEYMRDVPFTSLTELSEYASDFMFPNIDYIASGGMLKMNDAIGELGGIMLEVSVYDEYFDDILILMYYDNYVYAGEDWYNICINTSLWNGIDVKYSTVELENDTYDWRMKFSSNGVNYYLSFVFYADATVKDVMDMIFD